MLQTEIIFKFHYMHTTLEHYLRTENVFVARVFSSSIFKSQFTYEY